MRLRSDLICMPEKYSLLVSSLYAMLIAFVIGFSAELSILIIYVSVCSNEDYHKTFKEERYIVSFFPPLRGNSIANFISI